MKLSFLLLSVGVIFFISCEKEPNEPSYNNPITTVGSHFQGGYVVYVDESGQHGLIITDFDVDTCEWSNGPTHYNMLNSVDYYNTFGLSANEIGAGKYNTQLIIDSLGDNGIDYAAKVCADLVHEGYDDWFLPSREEIRKAYYSGIFPTDGVSLDNGAEPGYYWTSNYEHLVYGGRAIIHRLYVWLATNYEGQWTLEIVGPHMKVRAMREF
jgi:hypothetical protein